MSVTRQGSGAGITMRGPTLADFNFEILESGAPEIVNPPTTVSVVEADRVYDEYDGGDWLDHRQLAINGPEGHTAPVYTSLDGAVGTVDQAGLVTHVADGTVGILVRLPLLTRRIDLTLSAASVTTKKQTGWTVGTMGAAFAGDLDAAIAGLTPSAALPVFSARDGSARSFTLNPDCWTELLTSASVWRSDAAYKWPLHLVTPIHGYVAGHVAPAVGTDVLFYAGGTVYVRRVVGRQYHPGYAPGSLGSVDIAMVLFDTELPLGVTPAQVLPANFADWITLDARLLPTVCIDQNGEATVVDAQSLATGVFLQKPTDATRLSFYKDKVWGDSSCGIYLKRQAGATPILLGALTGSANASAIHTRIASVNQLITDLDTAAGSATGYTLTEADLSAHTLISAL